MSIRTGLSLAAIATVTTFAPGVAAADPGVRLLGLDVGVDTGAAETTGALGFYGEVLAPNHTSLYATGGGSWATFGGDRQLSQLPVVGVDIGGGVARIGPGKLTLGGCLWGLNDGVADDKIIATAGLQVGYMWQNEQVAILPFVSYEAVMDNAVLGARKRFELMIHATMLGRIRPFAHLTHASVDIDAESEMMTAKRDTSGTTFRAGIGFSL